MTIVATFDEGPGAGLGHRRRCEFIATALRARDFQVTLVPIGTTIDARVVLVDSYRERADDRRRFRSRAVVALDDLARDLDVALVVDPAPGASSAPHRRAGRVLAGSRFALVDPALGAEHVRSVEQEPSRLLVATGAADGEGTGAAIATAIAARYPALRVRLVVGPWGAPGAAGTDLVGVELVERPDGLATELAAADIVVTAGGVTLLEALCLGRPTVAIATAANQRSNVEGAAAAGAVLVADPCHAASTAARIIHSAALRTELSSAAVALVDGRGAERVGDAIHDLILRCAA